jgi:hypothetical protein
MAAGRRTPGAPSGALYADEFRQLDHNPGWYAGLSWERPDLGRIALLRYDNEADPAAHDSEFAWRTKFWSLGAATQWQEVVLLAQAMVGSTVVVPSASVTNRTDFWSAYLLAGIERDAWRYALRLDEFATSAHSPRGGPGLSEHGLAVTAAVTFSPRRWLHLIGEVLTADYWRAQRVLVDQPPHAIETQAQLVVRLTF